MHVRRALLLFALVFGLAALATAVSQRPVPERRDPAPAAPPPGADRDGRAKRDGAGLTSVRFAQGPKRMVREVRAGRPAEVIVAVDRPGLIELEGLGLSAPASRLTPARFDVLATRAGRHAVLLEPAGELASDRIGTLRVLPAR